MLALDDNHFITADQIASLTGISLRGVNKRLTSLDNSCVKFANNPARTGRPLKLYSTKEALALWNLNPDIIKIEEQYEVIRKNRNDKSKPRKLPIELEKTIVNRTRELYLTQGIKKYLYPSCKKACFEQWQILEGIEGFDSWEKLAWYIYNDRIMRKDENYKGYYWTEKWETLWIRRHNVIEANNDLPYAMWDYIGLFNDVKAIGEGFGAGDLWVVDGTQFDSWVKDDHGNPVLITILAIMDGITGMPLLLHPINSENITEIGILLLKCLSIYGLPKYGIVLDNSRTFRSKAIQNLIRSFYTKEQLQIFENTPWLKKMFRGQQGPIYYPLPKMPQFPIKARIEQFFHQSLNYLAVYMPGSYQASRESKLLKYELGTIPIYQLQHAPELKTALDKFNYIIFKEYVNRYSTSESLKSFAKITGQKPIINNAWRYYGGESRKGTQIPKENQAFAYYWLAPMEFHHIVKARSGHAIVIHDNTTYNYQCEQLNLDYKNEKVCVIPNSANPRYSFIYKEIYKKRKDGTPELTDIELIGIGEDVIIHTESDLDKLYKIQKNREIQMKTLDDKLRELPPPELGWDLPDNICINDLDEELKSKDAPNTFSSDSEIAKLNKDFEDLLKKQENNEDDDVFLY